MIKELRHVYDALLTGDDDSISTCMRGAARLLTTQSASEVLKSALGRRLPALEMLVTGLDHVGFVAATARKDSVSTAAAEAGFDAVNWLFPSKIIARELGELAGQASIPTAILKACGTSRDGVPLVVEVFMPDADKASVLEWIRCGVVPHVAFRVSETAHFDRIADLLRAEGLRLPRFMNGGPLTNPFERVTTLYVEGRPQGPNLRLEFCHYQP